MFVDRVRELETLNSLYRRPGSSLVVVYGRRRLGKTTLLREFAKDKVALYYLAAEESESENRKAFQRAAAAFADSTLLQNASVGSWEPLFQLIAETNPTQKKILVLDEFQYLGKANAAFPSILQRIWDSSLQHANVMLILCGSLVHMMESQTLNYSSPLYGRSGCVRSPLPASTLRRVCKNCFRCTALPAASQICRAVSAAGRSPFDDPGSYSRSVEFSVR